MATDSKTVIFCSDLRVVAVPDSTWSSLVMPTITLPESGKVFRSVTAHLWWTESPFGFARDYTQRRLRMALGASPPTTLSNANVWVHNGESMHGYMAVDMTSLFTTHWTGTAMTCTAEVFFARLTGIPTTNNVCLLLEITYEYDDTSPTHVKTVFYPLRTPDAAMATTKPASLMTVPAMTTELPEASKTFLGRWVLVGGNTYNTATVDFSMSMEMSTSGVSTTANFNGQLASSCSYTVIFNPAWNLTVSNTWHVWASLARFNHAYAYAIITYTFAPAATTRVYQSLMLPANISAPLVDTAGNRLRSDLDVWIEEPGSISTRAVATIFHWCHATAPTPGINFRANTADTYSVFNAPSSLVSGGCAGQAITNSYTLARGLQTLTAEVYTDDSAYQAGTFGLVWIINYESDKSTLGPGAHAKTRAHLRRAMTTLPPQEGFVGTAVAVANIPQPSYFVSNLGFRLSLKTQGGSDVPGLHMSQHRLAGEGGPAWDDSYVQIGEYDRQAGFFTVYADARRTYVRYTNDPDPKRLPLGTARSDKIFIPRNSVTSIAWFFNHTLITYHTHTWSITGTVINSAGGTVRVNLIDRLTGELLLTTTRVGDGPVDFTWFDDTREVYMTAHEVSLPTKRALTPFFTGAGTHTLDLDPAPPPPPPRPIIFVTGDARGEV